MSLLSDIIPGGSVVKSPCQCYKERRWKFHPWVRMISLCRMWQHAPVFLPGNFHGQKSLVGYSSWGCKESVTAEHTHIIPFLLLSVLGGRRNKSSSSICKLYHQFLETEFSFFSSTKLSFFFPTMQQAKEKFLFHIFAQLTNNSFYLNFFLNSSRALL